MPRRLTIPEVEAVIDRLNTVANRPATPHTISRPGANPGNFHLNGSGGSYSLLEITERSGSCRTIIGPATLRTLYTALQAYLAGYCNGALDAKNWE
jgi:hypothetical protein